MTGFVSILCAFVKEKILGKKSLTFKFFSHIFNLAKMLLYWLKS